MLDPDRMEQVLRRGGDVATVVAAWRSIHERHREVRSQIEQLRAKRNSESEAMAKLDKKSPEFAHKRDELKQLSTKMKEGDVELEKLEAETTQKLLVIPNAPHGDTFSRRRTMFCSLTCSHVQQKRSYRRFLIGESIVCEQCTAAARDAQPAFEGMF